MCSQCACIPSQQFSTRTIVAADSAKTKFASNQIGSSPNPATTDPMPDVWAHSPRHLSPLSVTTILSQVISSPAVNCGINLLHSRSLSLVICIKLISTKLIQQSSKATIFTCRQLVFTFFTCLFLNLFMFHLAAVPHSNYQAYQALVGNSIALPCNITPPTTDDGVSLILWYRDDLSSPIYTVDSRLMSHLHAAKHLFDASVLGNRASFNITYPVSYLRFDPVVESDTAEYRCRVDFRRGRTINRVMKLNIIVPTKKISLYDSNSNYINDIAGPFNEDSSLNITCESEGGNPLPSVKWWKGDVLLHDKSAPHGKSAVRNIISFPRLMREHLMMPLTCEASNTNLTVPVSKTVLIDLNLKPTEVRIIKPLENMTVGLRVQLVCQSSGSRPPAKIVWKKNQKILEHYSESTSDDGTVTTNFLTFVPNREDDGKVLTCAAFNPQFEDFRLEDTMQLDVHYAPILSLLLGASVQQQEIVEGSSVYFDCNIQANPQVDRVGWLFDDNQLNETQSGDVQVRNTSIVISSVNKAHIGSYQCYAANSLGKSVSEVVNLNVKFVPTCANDEESHYEIQPFEELTVECSVDSEPQDVTFYWEFNSTSQQPPDQYNEPSMVINNSGQKSFLKFTPRSSLDYGTLYCYAQNRIGRQRNPCVFHISKSEVPDAPQNCTLSNITATSLTVHCEPGEGEQPQKFVLLIYKDDSQLIRNVTSEDKPHFKAQDLPAGFNFNLFVYATNHKGHSDKIRIIASTLVGEPRKLEHIEQKMQLKPILALILLVGSFLVFTLFVLFILVKVRKRYKAKPKQDKSLNGASVFDTATASHTTATTASNAYSLQIRSCQSAESDCGRVATLDVCTPSNHSGSYHANAGSLHRLPSPGSTKLMSHSYLELTNLDRLLDGSVAVVEPASITQCPLTLSSKEHVTICPDVNIIPGELMYVHNSVDDNPGSSETSFFPNCLMLNENGDDVILSDRQFEEKLSGGAKFMSTFPCIIVPDSELCFGSDSANTQQDKVDSSTSGPNKELTSSHSTPSSLDDCPSAKSATKVRFCE